jgi:hypothetical protein
VILPIEIFVIALVNCGADDTEVTGLDVVGVGVGIATASTGTSLVGCAGLTAGTAGAVGAAGAVGSAGAVIVGGAVVVGGSGTPGSSSYATTDESFAVISESIAELSASASAESENELDEAGCWYSNAFVVDAGRFVRVARVAFATNCVTTCAGVRVGAMPNMFATTPATCGAAIEVPDLLEVAVGPVIPAEMMCMPGAKMSTHEPRFEKSANASVEVVAPTVIAEAALDGEKLQASEYELPAATTNVIPSATPRATASLIATSIPELVPRLMLATAGTPAT